MAQLAEQLICNQQVIGSSPIIGFKAHWLSWLERRPVTAEVKGSSPLWVVSFIGIYGVLAQLGEHLPYKQGVTGSSPVGPIWLLLNNYYILCRRGGTGRRAGLKILLWQHSTGSIPVAGSEKVSIRVPFFVYIFYIKFL